MEKTRFTNLVNSLSVVAERDKWIPKYDKEADYFYWTRKNLNKDSMLVQVSHESSFYVNPKGKIEGVMIEYLNNNFIAHNPSYKSLIKQFTKKIDDDCFTVADKKKAEKYLFALGQALRADIYQDVRENNKEINMDALVKFAFAS